MDTSAATTAADARLAALLEEVDLPERAYELAEGRYEDLAEWIGRPGSALARYDSHIFVQGSFALGTAIRPVNDGEEYDLDFSCKLRRGVSRDTQSQAQVKALLGAELEAYRVARQIQKRLDEKRRCWRLGYRDDMPFHMDVVPGIRADELRRRELRELMEQKGVEGPIAQEAARRALWITDIRDPAYHALGAAWPSSNPGGYQLWFRSRMRALEKRMLAEAQVDPVPVYRSKSPLQQVVQLLKRHRDKMFKDLVDAKPASIILTTVAGHVYQVGDSLSQTMRRVLDELERIRVSDTDKILNPVNPAENFADRWGWQDCAHLQLKKNFHDWVRQANSDFTKVMSDASRQRMVEIAEDALAVKLSDDTLRRLGYGAAPAQAPARVVAAAEAPPRPWAR